MNNYQLWTQQLEHSKQKFAMLLKDGKIEQAHSIIRDASFVCNKLGKNVVAEFYHMVFDADTTTKVLELKELVQNNLIKCPKCDFVVKSTQSMNSHWGKKHKIK